MKQILQLVFKGLLIVTLLALVILLVFGVVLWIGWRWWVGFFVLIGLCGLVLAFVVVRKILSRRREQMFVHQVIAQDESIRKALTPKEQDGAKELQARWKEAVEALRKSHLRKFGNPLYVLPWYMVIGESGSGKTTAIQSAKLSSPFAQVSKTSGISGTRNCDWWFFEQAILIDTAGRYALPVDEGRDKEEWQRFLTLLAKFRKKEPLNGLVVTIAADRLAQATHETLQEDGRNIRKRIEELTRVLGARSPVYVMVTKCDLIQGATQFCDQISEESLNQAMGYINQQLNSDAAGVIDKAIRTVGERLRELRLLLLHRSKEDEASAGMLLFPEEFEKLKEGLTAFVGSAFQENPYQETPLLRGIFFSSGRQEGTPYSHFLNALGLIQEREVLQGTNKGLFLHDFFTRILPTDRHLFKPTQHIQEWKKLTRNMGLTAWIAIMIALCGLLSYAFVKNLNALSDVRREFRNPAILQGDLLPDVITMDRFRQAVLDVEAQNRNWWIPRLGLNESLRVESELKRKYVGLFQNGFLKQFDKRMGERMAKFGAHTPNADFGAHVAHLVRRINILKARLDQKEIQQLTSYPRPDFGAVILSDTDIIPEMQKKLGIDYLYALSWQDDAALLNEEMNHLQTWLKHLLTKPGVTLNWLADWVNAEPALSPVTLYDFWGGEPAEGLPTVPPSFTREGKARIETVIGEMEAALFDPLIISSRKTEFSQWYDDNYYKAWQTFVQSFDQGTNLLKKRDHWQAIAKRIPTDSGPYYSLVLRTGEEFLAYGSEKAVPSWVGLGYDLQDVRKEAGSASPSDLEKSGLFSKATRQVTSRIKQAEKALGVRVHTPMAPEAQMNAAKAFVVYQTALEAAVKATGSQKMAFEMTSALFQQDMATGDSPFLVSYRAIDELKAVMADTQDENEQLFWNLIEGNIRLIQTYAIREAACELQRLWDKEVLIELQDVSADVDMAQIMMGNNGYATAFLKGSAEPFVGRDLRKGYFAKKAAGMELPFDDAFFAYLTKGARAARPTRSKYSVKIRAYPTDTNPQAQIKPHLTVLELQCADGTTRFENYNYPKAKTFTWSPQDCGDVIFNISVGRLQLTKIYRGHYAFAKFLDDFKTGQHIFDRSEFPSEEAALRRLGIRYIKAKYQFQGHKGPLSLLYRAPGSPPRIIVRCWD